MKKTEEEKKIKIITQDKTIELIAKNGQKPIVKIDGQQEENEQELQEQGIEQSYDQVYVRTSSVRVQFDGEEVKVKVRRFTIFLAFQLIHSFV
jgi:glycerate kinase